MPIRDQRYDDVVISGIAHVDAPEVVLSSEIDERLAPAYKRMKMAPGLLDRVVGVHERRFWHPGEQPSARAAEAGLRALEASGVDRRDVGVLINTSVSRDYVEPATASIAHAAMGLPSTALSFDLVNACLGFVNGMNLVSTMIARGEIDHGVVVNAETSRPVVEATLARLEGSDDRALFREQFATLTLGSGAVAMVLSRDDLAQGHRYLGGLSRARTEHALLCTGQVDEMRTDLGGLLEAGVDMARLTWKDAVDAFDWDPDAFDLHAMHQVSLVHTRACADTLGLDIAKFPLTFPRFGNMGPASVPTVLSHSEADGRLVPGMRVALMGVGSGINAAAAEVVW